MDKTFVLVQREMETRGSWVSGLGVGSTGFSLRVHGDGDKQSLRVPLLWFRAGPRDQRQFCATARINASIAGVCTQAVIGSPCPDDDERATRSVGSQPSACFLQPKGCTPTCHLTSGGPLAVVSSRRIDYHHECGHGREGGGSLFQGDCEGLNHGCEEVGTGEICCRRV